MPTKKSNVNVKIEADVKELASIFLARMGLDQTTAIDLFYRQIIAEKRLPFQPIVNPTLDEELRAVILTKNIPRVRLETDSNGHVLVDHDTQAKTHDWAVNG
jgi:DNA-damage-inducible protein J